MLAKMVNRDFLVALASSLLTLVLRPLIADAVSVAGKAAAFASAAVEFLARDDTVFFVGRSVFPDDGDDGGPPPCSQQRRRRSQSHSSEEEEEPPPPVVVLTCGDAAAVTARLGLSRWTCDGGGNGGGGSSECRACGAAEVVAAAAGGGGGGGPWSEWELEEAFHVFDRGEDGFICAAELWSVMRRLGFAEGACYEDCRRMVRAFDEDGDGRISFTEFRRMMENAAW